MDRYDLTDLQWQVIEPLLPRKSIRGGRPWKNHRTMINGMLWMTNSGSRWRELPERYGPWQSVYDRYNNWRSTGLWDQMILSLLHEHEEVDLTNWDATFLASMRSRSQTVPG